MATSARLQVLRRHEDFLAIHVKKAHMSNGLASSVALSILLSVTASLFIPTGVDSFGIVVNASDVKDTVYSIISDICREIEPDDITMVDRLALVSVVGRNMSGVLAPLSTLALGNAGVSIHMNYAELGRD